MNTLQQQREAFKQRLAKQPVFKRNIVNHNVQNNNSSTNKLHNKIFDARKIQKKPSNV